MGDEEPIKVISQRKESYRHLSVGNNLFPELKAQTHVVLRNFADLLLDKSHIAMVWPHTTELVDLVPVKAKAHPVPLRIMDKVKEETDTMVK